MPFYAYGSYDNQVPNPDLYWSITYDEDLTYNQFNPVVVNTDPASAERRPSGVYAWNETPPPGWEWYGSYLPVVVSYDNTYRVGPEFSNPYHAYMAAREWIAASPGRDNFNAMVAFSGIRNQRALAQLLAICGETIDEPAELVGTTNQSVDPIGTSCSKCGVPGHNRRTCSSFEDIDKVGIEIEGRWINIVTAKRKADDFGARYCSDGSVNRISGYSSLEFQTAPGTVAQALGQLVELYPDHTGPDCGMHVHVSFKCATYFTQLACKEFYEYFKQRWIKWGTDNRLHPQGEFFRRLNGGNNYCMPNQESRAPYGEDRYTQLNFAAWHEHKTVECRLLPMFRSTRLAVSAVLELIKIYKDWLSKDFSLALPEENLSYMAQEGMKLSLANEVDLAEFGISSGPIPVLTPGSHTQTLLNVQNIEPPAPGMRRIAASPTTAAFLRTLLAA